MIVEFGVGILIMAAAPVFPLSVAAATVLSIGAFGFLPAYTTLVAAVVSPLSAWLITPSAIAMTVSFAVRPHI